MEHDTSRNKTAQEASRELHGLADRSIKSLDTKALDALADRLFELILLVDPFSDDTTLARELLARVYLERRYRRRPVGSCHAIPEASYDLIR